METIAFFNNRCGVGQTTLVYHVAWMLEHLGLRVVVADLDPQSTLTSALVSEQRIRELWEASPPLSLYGAIERLVEGLGDIEAVPHAEAIGGIVLLPGDLALSRIEDRLGAAWSQCMSDDAPNASDGFRVMSAFYRVIRATGERYDADVALLDVGPQLGALNRAALVAADYVVVPLGADLFSLRGLGNVGHALADWRTGWQERLERPAASNVAPLPGGGMRPIGYVVHQHAARKASEPLGVYQRWIDRFPAVFHRELLGSEAPQGEDPQRLALLRHFRGLHPIAVEARKPVFDLKAADGAIGGYAAMVNDARLVFEQLSREIARRAGVSVPVAHP